MSNTYGHIEEADGTVWRYAKTNDPYGRHIPGREYWVSYCNGPAPRGIVGFYASSIEDAINKLK